ncbi:hypothetical protein KCP75_01545 [Salmonella enterica subsp. enterica]|nr:hypothetical protein KCP75_01545 [Salmonella enterica subsp. enterica]
MVDGNGSTVIVARWTNGRIAGVRIIVEPLADGAVRCKFCAGRKNPLRCWAEWSAVCAVTVRAFWKADAAHGCVTEVFTRC